MRNTIALLLIAFFSACGGNELEGIIFSGQVDWIKLSPGAGVIDDDGELLSNGCGLSETKFTVKEVFFGPDIDFITIRVEMGEWCESPYPVIPMPLFVSARKTDDGWVGGIAESIQVDSDGRFFIAPMYNGILFGCSTDSWRTPIEDQFLYEDRELAEIRRDHLIDEGHLKLDGEKLMLNNVIYIDRVAEMARSSQCLASPDSN